MRSLWVDTQTHIGTLTYTHMCRPAYASTFEKPGPRTLTLSDQLSSGGGLRRRQVEQFPGPCWKAPPIILHLLHPELCYTLSMTDREQAWAP